MLASVLLGATISAGVGTAFAAAGAFGATLGTQTAGQFFLSSFAKSAALGVLSSKLAPKNLGEAITDNQRDPIGPRQIVYGVRRVGGTIVAVGTSDWVRRDYDNDGNEGFERYSNNQNAFYHSIIAIAGHEITSIDEVFFHEVKVSNGATSGDQFPFDVDSKFRNRFDAAPTPGTQADVCRFRLGTSSQTVINDLVFNSNDLTPPFRSDYQGDSSYPRRYAERYVDFDEPPVDFAGIDSNFKLNDTAYIYFRGYYDQGFYDRGVPKITVKVKGKPIYDPRTSATATNDNLDNPALIIRDYLLDTKYGLGCSADEIDETAFAAAADACDELVSDGDGGQEKRYRMSAVFASDNTPRDVIDKMLTSCGGQLVYTNGKFRLLAGEWRTPTVSLDEKDCISAVRVATKNSARQSYNKVQGTFFSEADNYLATDYPMQTDASYSTIDGRDSSQNLDLPFTNKASTAQRIARLHLVRSRQETTISLDATLKALELTAGDTFRLTNARMGWSNKTFEVIETRLNINGLSPSVSISAVESSEAIYTAADTGNFIDAIITQPIIYKDGLEVIQPPESLSVTSEGVLDEDGKVQTKWSITFRETPSQNGLIGYELQWKLASDTVYDSMDIGNTTEIVGVGNVVVGQSYNVRVRAVGRGGEKSSFINTTHTMAGDITAPATPSGLTATGSIESIILDWSDNTEGDFKHYQVFRSTSNNIPATPIATVDASQFVSGGLAASTTYYFWIKAVDFSGNVSPETSVASATTSATPGAGQPGADGSDGADGAGTYTYDLSSGTTSGLPSSTVNGYFTGSGGANRSPVTSDVLIVKRTDDSEATAYVYGGSTWAEQVGGYFHGDVLIEGTLTVDRLKSGNLANNNNVSFEIGSGVDVGGYSTVAAFKTGDSSNLALVAETSVNYPAFAVGGYNVALHAAGIYNGTGSTYSALNSFCEFSTNTAVTIGSSNYTVSLRTGGNSAYSAWQDNGLTVVGGGRARFSATSLSFANPTTVTSNRGYVITNFGNTSTTDTSLAFDTGFYYNYSTNTIHFPNSASPFTGSHEALIDLSLNPDVGDIMVDSQVIEKGNISNVLTKVVKSSSVNQRTAIGVYVSRIDVIPEVLRVVTQTSLSEEPDPDNPPNDVTVGIKQGFADTLIDNDVCLVNALGEGQINVCNEGGDIVAGDLIVTSSIAGKGMKQADDFVRGYTVAKARESVTFTSATQVKQIACIYLCG